MIGLPAVGLLNAFQLQQPVVDLPNSVEDNRTNDDKLTWTLRASWEATDWLNVYVSAATGFKSSSWNLSRDTRPLQADFAALASAGLLPEVYTSSGTRLAEPEEATVYEIGFKARFDTATFNIALFDQTIEGFQSATFLGTGFGLTNAGEQSTKGIEVEANWSPTNWFDLVYSATFLDPLYDSFPAGVDGVTDLSGEQPAGIHEVSMSTAVTFTKDFDNGASAYFRADWLYEDGVQTNEETQSLTFPLTGAEQPIRKVNTINASIGYEFVNGLSLQVWARNLFNDEYVTTVFPTPGQFGFVTGYRNAPRTWGLSARYRF